MSKKYKLLKDLPNARAGTILTDTMDGYYVCYSNGTNLPAHQLLYLKEYVENMSDWFEEVKPEKIEVGNVWFASDKPDGGAFWAFDTNQQVHPSKLTLVKEAIERVLNEDGSTYSPFSNVTIDYDGITVTVGGEEYVSKKEVDKIRETAFNAARRLGNGGILTGYVGKAVTYPSFADYYNDLQR